MENNQLNSAKDSILYEVLEYFIRKQEPELTKSKNDSVTLQQATGTIKNALRYLNNRYSLPESISQQIRYTLPWKLAIGDNGKILALLQENIIEIRKAKDEFSSVVGKASAPKDSFPEWRKLAWSPNGLILALASSNGYISFYNSLGNNIFNISTALLSPNPHVLEAGDAIATMIFKKPRVETDNWDYEFIGITYSGLLKSYCISSSNGYSENHTFSFSKFYRNGINAIVYSEKYNLFFVAGNSVLQNLNGTASQIGLTCWRTLNDNPYYKLSPLSEENDLYKSQFSIWNFISIIKNRVQSIIFRISISPNSQLLAAIHTDGTISLWSIPTLKLKKQWKLLEQPDYNSVNPLQNIKFKKCPPNLTEYHPLDISWWSNNAVIIARYSGAISVCSIDNLKNLLGTSPEFLFSYPQIAPISEESKFLCLDCEVVIGNTKRTRDSIGEGQYSELSSDSEKEDDETKSVTILNYSKNLMQSALYSITDIEKFQPKRKKSKIFYKTYKVLGIKRTTPEELYARKIELQDYEEALTLAKTYNLDPDLVYQTQWRKSECSLNAIQEHLSKVSKRSWVLNECITRVPETLEATRELLNFGLKGANLETVVNIAMHDDNKFFSAESDDDDSNQDNVQKLNEILDSITANSLSESQISLIKCRKKLLSHLDKLQTYEFLLEDPNKFNKIFYEEFRELSPIENAIKFAKKGDCRGVEIMFTYYGKLLMPHYLAIINFFPETLDPEMYQKLLPECDNDGRPFLLYQQELRPKDWVEKPEFDHIKIDNNENVVDMLYENRISLISYRNKQLSQDLIQKWYINRAYEIESDSRLVDNALSLINLGKARNIHGLEKILFDLETLDDIVYKVGNEDLSLIELEKLSDLEKINLLMLNSDQKNFISIIKNMLLPFFRRRKHYLGGNSDKELFYEYLISLSKHSLDLPLALFEYLKTYNDFDLLNIIQNITSLAYECIYACDDKKFLPKATSIFHILMSMRNKEDFMKCKDLEHELKCIEILNKYNVFISLNKFNNLRNDFDKSKELFNEICENFSKSHYSPNEKQWNQLLNDMLDIQEYAFKVLDVEACFEICLYFRLKSGSISIIQGSKSLIETNKKEHSPLKVAYDKAVEIIIKSSNDYFNNAKSLIDPDMELAKACLHLITDKNDEISKEYNLIESLQILNEFNIEILPLQVRLLKEKITLIENCLNNKANAYKSKQKLLNLANYLRIESKNVKLREGKVLDLIARKAFDVKDFKFCASIITQMMKNNYQLSWEIALKFGFNDDYDDLKFQLSCLWFSVSNGPNEIIEKAIKRANILQVQLLNTELEKWTPENYEPINSDDFMNDFKPLANLTKIDKIEVVPKILESSAYLVKNSAQKMKQSSIDLINTASNPEFWKSKFNFEISGNPDDDKESESCKNSKNFLRVPCFYESLYEQCAISNLDIRYNKFSKTECSPNLRLSQILLRMGLLNETATYGEEFDGINHLLLECTKYTITEDYITGLSYLLSVDDEDYFDDVISLFYTLPHLKIYSEYLAYFLSIKLYIKQMDCDIPSVFLHSPINLIKMMSTCEISDENLEKQILKQTINDLIKKKCMTEQNSGNSVNESESVSKPTENKEDLNTELSTNPPEELDDWNNWEEDDWADVNEEIVENKVSVNKCETLEEEELTDENYHKIIQKLLKIENANKFKELKNEILMYPQVMNFIFSNDLNVNAILCLIFQLTKINLDDEEILDEIKNIFIQYTISKDVLAKFIENNEDNFSSEQIIYLKLCSKDSELKMEAVEFIKNNYTMLKLNYKILEEIFFNDLTFSFSVSHELYYRILEEIFMNRTLPEIEKNIKLLIDMLLKQGNVPHAIALLNQLEGIPSSLSTYDNCFKLLLKKDEKLL